MPLLASRVQPLICSNYYNFLLEAVEAARQTIVVLMFDWRRYPNDPSCGVQKINQALFAARRRGVKVRMLINSSAAAKYFVDLGLEVKEYRGRGLLHSKLVVIDNNLTILGSHNLTMNALSNNQETSVAILDKPTALVFSEFFQQLWLL